MLLLLSTVGVVFLVSVGLETAGFQTVSRLRVSDFAAEGFGKKSSAGSHQIYVLITVLYVGGNRMHRKERATVIKCSAIKKL